MYQLWLFLGEQRREGWHGSLVHCWPPLTHHGTAVGSYHVDLLAFHWLTSLACLDKAGVYDRLRVSEAALIDPMASLFSYGLLRQDNQKDKERFRPRASFGIRTNLVDDSSSASATVCASPRLRALDCRGHACARGLK